MLIPEGKTKEEVQATILKVANRFASSFSFGYLTYEDIRQQASQFAIEALPRYNPSKPLEAFLFAHVKFRLINFKRDNYKRTDHPCKLCYGMQSGCTGHPDRMHCEKYKVWHKRNLRKQNVLMPLDIGNISDEKESRTRQESTVVEDVSAKEILDIIDRDLPVEYRAQYLQMKEGLSVPKAKRVEIEKVVNDILKGGLYE